MTPVQLDTMANLAVAVLVGLAVGIEREWSGKGAGPAMRFAGVRTFLLLGIIGGIAGWLARSGLLGAAVTLLGGGAALAVAAYVMSARPGGEAIEGTTEAAALVVLALAFASGLGQPALASGATAVVVLVLAEKARFHATVRRIGENELRAAFQFAVLALVVLPLLPPDAYGPYGGIRPRSLWTLVLLFSGLNFLGHLARHVVGASRGYGVTGLLGGLVSSTAVALKFSRQSRAEPALAASLATGVVGASTVALIRVLVVSTILNAAVAFALLPYLAVPTLLGAILVAFRLWHRVDPETQGEEPKNPLGLASAIQMAILFQLAIFAIGFVRETFGTAGVIATAAVLGLTDVDALTVAMTRNAATPVGIVLGAQAIAIGVLSNTVVKLAVALALGERRYRRAVAAGMGLLAISLALGLALIPRF
jgi:uncharacterized membrane protein (DUF4010 family)